MDNTKPLIILTRPYGRSDSLIAKLHKNNYSAINIPCLAIKYLRPQFHLTSEYSKFIFVSVNAVEGFFKLYSTSAEIKELIVELNKRSVYAIGAATAELLKNYGISNVIYPSQANFENSEDFVKLIQLQNIAEDRVLMIRGEQSRGFISAKLSKECTSFTEIIVYRGECPKGVISKGSIGSINEYIIVVTSASILENFYKKLDNNLRSEMLNAKILVPSQRIAIIAKDLGFKNIYCSNSMNEETILDMINKISKQI